MIMIREPLPGRYELAKAYDTSDVDQANAEMRKTDPWSPLRGLRRAASIPVEDLRRLVLVGDLDATAALAGDDGALRRLIRAHPEWRTSEGRL